MTDSTPASAPPTDPTSAPVTAALTEKEAIERVAQVVLRYRHLESYTEYAVAALVLDALRWPRSDGTVPDA